MLIEKSEKEDFEKRCVRKEFKCLSCFRFFRKLVQVLIKKIQCPFCYSDNCLETNNSKNLENNKNNEFDNSSLKTDFTIKGDEEEKKVKLIDNNSKNNFTFLNKKKLLENIKPFSISPFHNSVHPHEFDIDDIIDDGILTTNTEDFFRDNYSSNFISNFDNPLGRMVFIQMQINNNSKSKSFPSFTPKELRQIQKFEMSIDYCKVSPSDKNDYELPNCIFCLKDILIETNCFLLRCGHLIHEQCFLDWAKEHKICPVCKFPILKKGVVRKSSLDLILDDTIKEESKIEKSFPLSDSESENIDKQKNIDIINDNEIDIMKLIDNENNNINIIGEKKEEMESFFEEVLK